MLKHHKMKRFFFFFSKIGFSSRIRIIFEQRSVSTECCGQEGMAAFLHSINESQIKCVPVSLPNVYLLHVFHFLLNIIIHNQMKRIVLYLFTCKTGFRYGRLSTLGKKRTMDDDGDHTGKNNCLQPQHSSWKAGPHQRQLAVLKGSNGSR